MNTGAPLPGKLILGANIQCSFRIPDFLSCHTGILSVTPGLQSPKNAFRTTQKYWRSSNPGGVIKCLKLEKILTIRKWGTDRNVICLITRMINYAYYFSKLKVCDKYKRKIRRRMFITLLSHTKTQMQTILSGGFCFYLFWSRAFLIYQVGRKEFETRLENLYWFTLEKQVQETI